MVGCPSTPCNQLGLGKRHWNLETSSTVVVPPPYREHDFKNRRGVYRDSFLEVLYQMIYMYQLDSPVDI